MVRELYTRVLANLRLQTLGLRHCRSGGMADATVSKTVARKGVWVRLPPSAPSILQCQYGIRWVLCYLFYLREWFALRLAANLRNCVENSPIMHWQTRPRPSDPPLVSSVFVRTL